GVVKKMLRHTIPLGIVYVAVIAVLAVLLARMPTAFLPEEDQGIIFTLVQLPPNASLDRTSKVIEQVTDHFLSNEKDAIQSIFTVGGFSFTGIGQNSGMAFIRLKDWEDRKADDLKVGAVVQRS
ncbi:efflux RND transporter permease subunit, partial [Rhizobium hidalgonense]